MKKSAFTLFLISTLFANCLMPQGAFPSQDDSVSILVTVLDAPPEGTVVINNGDAYTNSTAVNLSLFAADAESSVTEMQFSNDGIAWSSPEAYAATKSWVLIFGDGEKAVYAKFKDAVGNWSDDFSDTIILNGLAITIIDYIYDDLNRLEKITHDGISTEYVYDEVGNAKNKIVRAGDL